ncbi:MAG: 16S rRNA (uracil(1498)-N(3))-methyltransferase [Acetobacter sp.]|nr:16S rRNA (uracil(1498)-N(3))-methyltransferase [Acetobacter sp.]
MAKNFRLYTKEELILGKTIILNEEQTHYLKNVVKYTVGETLNCFDNKNGEFLCEISEITKKNITLKTITKIKELANCPDIWLLFAPLKKDKTDFVIEKATELGCRKIIPTLTRYTITGNIKIERYIAQSIEAAEQCRRTDLPEIIPAQKLEDILADWDSTRPLYFMDETLQSRPFSEILSASTTPKAAILIGPEGGFSPEELNLLRRSSFAKGATLGPRILRAETAVAAALSCWQMMNGDWRN